LFLNSSENHIEQTLEPRRKKVIQSFREYFENRAPSDPQTRALAVNPPTVEKPEPPIAKPNTTSPIAIGYEYDPVEKTRKDIITKADYYREEYTNYIEEHKIDVIEYKKDQKNKHYDWTKVF
jgi:hypothetical protein